MKKETEERITLALKNLVEICDEEDVGIMIYENGELLFFDAEQYVKNKTVTGFKTNIRHFGKER